jgi:hypothetical protein
VQGVGLHAHAVCGHLFKESISRSAESGEQRWKHVSYEQTANVTRQIFLETSDNNS